MSRDKLLTIRIEEGKREAFNNWCEVRDYSYSKFLYKVIEGCLSGRIDESIFSGEPVDNDLGSKLLNKIEQVDESIDKRISENLVNYLDNKVDKHLDSKLDSRIDKTVDKHLDSKLNKAIALLENNAVQDNVITEEKLNKAIALLRKDIEPLLEAERSIGNLASDEKFIQMVASEVKK